MSHTSQYISSKASTKDASFKMKETNVGFLPVCEEDEVIGVITDRDIVIRGIGQNIDISSPVE